MHFRRLLQNDDVCREVVSTLFWEKQENITAALLDNTYKRASNVAKALLLIRLGNLPPQTVI